MEKTKVAFLREGIWHEGWTFASPKTIKLLGKSRKMARRMTLIVVHYQGSRGSIIYKVPACMIEVIEDD